MHVRRDARMAVECPTCKYDLTGLPDGACPECGGWFSHQELAQLDQAKQRSSRDNAKLLRLGVVILIVLVVASGWASTLNHRYEPAGVLAMLALLIYALTMSAQPTLNKWLARGLVAMPVLALASSPANDSFAQIIVLMGAIFCGIGVALAWLHPRIAVVLALIPCFYMAWIGVGITVQGLWRLVAGFKWTDYDWPFSAHDGYGVGITARDGVWFGPIVIVLAVLLVATVVRVACWRIGLMRAVPTSGSSTSRWAK
jgi:hypothetical protein